MAPDAGDRLQFGVRQERQFGRVVGDAEIEVGLARHQQHARRIARSARGRSPPYSALALMSAASQVRKLRIQVGGGARAETILPVGAQERLQVGRAEIGLRPRCQMQAGAIEILAQRPAA